MYVCTVYLCHVPLVLSDPCSHLLLYVFTEELVMMPAVKQGMDIEDTTSSATQSAASSTASPTAVVAAAAAAAATTTATEESGRKRNYPFVAPGKGLLTLTILAKCKASVLLTFLLLVNKKTTKHGLRLAL